MRPAVLASGGMDSFLAWALFARDAINVFVDIGHKYAAKEKASLNKLCSLIPDFRILFLTGSRIAIYEHESGIIPLRNIHLILEAAQHYDEIILGVLKDEINSDKSELFFHLSEQLLNECWREQYWTEGREFSIHSPLRKYSKAQLVKIYKERGLPIEWLAATVSCYSAGHIHCGNCPSCAKRWIALKLNDLEDINEWQQDPAIYIAQSGILAKALDGTYQTARAEEVMQAMEGNPACKSI